MGNLGWCPCTPDWKEGRPMNIVIGSAFRNSTRYLIRYLNQVARLKLQLGKSYNVRVIAVEGDSTDSTEAMLRSVQGIDIQVVKHEHGGPVFGSTEHVDRMVALSKICNAIFDAVNDKDDILFYVESDLIWDALTAQLLIEYAARREQGYDVFAPMPFAGANFYDVWGFRGLDGERFAPFAPYHSSMRDESLNEVSSVGSALVMQARVARKCRVKNDYCLVGWCEDARSKGYRIAVDPSLRIAHPA
jgi:hypothetical protein